jgi:hypothetical protein
LAGEKKATKFKMGLADSSCITDSRGVPEIADVGKKAGEAISPFSRAHQEIARARINDRLLALAKAPVSPPPERDRQCANPATTSQLQLGRASCMADRKSRL